MNKYYVVSVSEDGDIRIREMGKGELEESITTEAEDAIEAGWESPRYLERLPTSDPLEWGGGTLIIKGEIVAPKPRQVVTRYEIE